ncbi:hypothetical protein ALC57_03909 [Trachymyrmex cornetzi]|uniref:Reverse transcriptase RNase H-like domain-containing protein n=1 Tax=Trachymyrmex cornetzi TaxID=471704 RepID=A0A151JLQ6_9HYME|nr:hypothetical protein ALC57_03909 [Trachymyrmex cornetzi]
MKQQQVLLAQLINLNINNHASTQSTSFQPTSHSHNINTFSSSSGGGGSDGNPPFAGVNNAQAVTLLASYIPVFHGSENEDIELWIQKVDNISRIHEVNDKITLLAASQKLRKHARDWYDMEAGLVNESWSSFKNSILSRFRVVIPFHVLMQRIEARRWNLNKEIFQEYAFHKIKLMHRLQVPEENKIQLLINGINSASLRASAMILEANTLDEFLFKMQKISSTFTVTHNFKKSFTYTRKEYVKTAPSSPSKNTSSSSSKETSLKNPFSTSSKESHSKDNEDISCAYCKIPGHIKKDCYKLKRKEKLQTKLSTQVSSPTTVKDEPRDTASGIGCVVNGTPVKLEVKDSVVEINSFNGVNCKLFALIDTGSHVSFIKPSIYKTFYNQQIPSYFSQATNDAENKYHSYELEILAVVKAIERFHIYLYGLDLTVITAML